MTSPDFLGILSQFGPLGLLIVYFIWRDDRAEKRRGETDKERAEADKALASALTALTVTIGHLEQRVK